MTLRERNFLNKIQKGISHKRGKRHKESEKKAMMEESIPKQEVTLD